MAYTFKELPNGNVDVLENGVSISQGGPGFSASYAKTLGWPGPASAPTAAPTNTIPMGNGTPQGYTAATPPAPTATSSGASYSAPPVQPTQTASTGSFNLGGFQSAPPTAQSSSLSLPPIAGGDGQSTLRDFSNALDYATNLAKTRRNASSLGLMNSVAPGTLPASSFNGILSNLNAAGDNTAQNLTNRAITAATPTYKVEKYGNDTYQVQYDESGKAIGANKIFSAPENYSYSTMTDPQGNVYAIQEDAQGKPVGQQLIFKAPEDNKFQTVSPGSAVIDPKTGQPVYTNPTSTQQNGTGGTPTKVEAPLGGGAPSTFTKSDKSEVEQALRSGTVNGKKIGNAIGSDGYIDPAGYVAMMQYWIDQGGTKQSFFTQFPVKTYINPANTWVWDELGIANPNKTSTSSGGGIANPFQ